MILTRGIMLGFLLTLFGCAPKLIVPTGPGVSAKLRYPVLVVGDKRLLVKDDESSLTRTTVASGINFLAATLIDADGNRYTTRNVTDFGRKSVWLDMGTTPFRIFLDLKAEGKATVAQAKKVVLDERPETKLDNVTTIAALMEACRR